MKWIWIFLCLPAFGQLPVLPYGGARPASVVTNALDTFETYTPGADLQGLSGGTGFAGNYNHLGTANWSNGLAGWEYRASTGISMGFNNVIGGNPSVNTINAISNLYNGLVTDSLDTKMHSVVCVATDDLACATATLIVNAGYSIWVNTAFVAADLTVNGLVGDGSTKFLDSGVIPSATMSLTDGGITEYIYTGNNTFACDIGVFQSGTQEIRILLGVSSTTTTCDIWSQNNGRLTFADLNRQGYLSLNRGVLGGGVTEALFGGSSGPGHTTLASNSLANDGTLPSSGSIFAFDSNGNANFSNHRLSFFAIHHALVSADSSNFYTRIQAFRTAEGGGFR